MNENATLNIPLFATDQNVADIISWSVLNAPSGYTLTPGANGSATLVLNTNYSSSGVYAVQVTATDGNGGISSRSFNLTVNDAAPAVPVLNTAQFIFGTGVNLVWQDLSNNETGFEIWRSTSSGGIYSLTGTVNAANATSFTDNTAAGNTLYYYKVKSKNAVDVSGFSNSVSVFTNRVPQISSINNVVLKTNQSTIVNITATDDVSDVIRLTATGLPAFATLSDYGNGTGQINIIPNTGSIGIYTVTVTAKDSYDSARSTTFTINIIDKDVTSVYLNLTDNVSVAGKPWNNLLNASFVGAVFSGLKDDVDNASSITVSMLDGFGWTPGAGMRTRNGKEVYPESVMRVGVIEPTTTNKRIEISGLALTGYKYNFVFFNSYDQDLSFITNFTINGQTVTLDAKYNSTKTVQINGITPDANGKVIINVAKNAGADYALLSSLIIQSYPTSVAILSPADLRVTSTTRTTASLQWQDRSDNEEAVNGFQIFRADNFNPNYVQVGSVNVGVTSFTDVNLTPNKTYYYAVRAKKSGVAVYSSYSNLAVANTLTYAVYVNFNNVYKALAPWNNLNTIPQFGYVWNNLKDETNTTTSLSMTQTNTWSGLYGNGINTGSNTGVYPDNVMRESYGLFPGAIGKFKVTGLNVGLKYDFTFFASANDYSDVTVAYTIGNKTSLFNASLNKTGTITMYNIVADEKW